MDIHVRIHRWVVWWIYVGLGCGAIAVANILGHHLTGAQERLLLLLGAAHWILGGIVCWAFDGVRIESGDTAPAPPSEQTASTAPDMEYHPASDFLLPGATRNPLRRRH